MKAINFNKYPALRHVTGRLWRRNIYLAMLVMLFVPTLIVQSSSMDKGFSVPASAESEGDYWKLVSTDQNQTWKGDNFHGLLSEYAPIFEDNAIGATYTQYNDARKVISSQLQGVCSWNWDNGAVPSNVFPGINYPFTMAVDANGKGNGFLGTVNGYTFDGGTSIAFAQVFFDLGGTGIRSGHQEASKSLTLPPGKNYGEKRTETLMCQVDIVEVKRLYFYEWSQASCHVTLSLPDKMAAGKEFTPLATVVNNQNQPVKPQKETWYYNGDSASPMMWDGSAGTVEYEYVCPAENFARKAKINIPAGAACSASIILPKQMKSNKPFTPTAVVVDKDKKPVKPKNESWYYNGKSSPSTMVWDGNAATVDYQYTCSLDQQPGQATIDIPPLSTCTASITLPDKMEPNKAFTPLAVVLGIDKKPVKPNIESWSYNGNISTDSIVWNGKAATVDYQYICPLDQQPGKATAIIPPSQDSAAWVITFGAYGVVVAAGLAAVAAGAVLVKTGAKKGAKPDPQPPIYVLQVQGKGLGVKKNLLEVRVREHVPLNIQAWRILPNGTPVPAPEAAIQVSVPPSPAGLVVAPGVGQGRLECAFSIPPKPTICADLMATVIASAKGVKVRTQVKVSIVPVYELKLEWYGSDPGTLQPGVKEVFARACLTAEPPPDALTTPDVLADKINLVVQGPNSERIRLQYSAPSTQGKFVQNGFLWIPITLSILEAGTPFQPGNPTLVASFIVDGQRLEQRLVLKVSEGLVMDAWVNGRKETVVCYQRKQETPAWEFADIFVFFHSPDDENTPVSPSFRYGFDKYPLIVQPPILDVKEAFGNNAPDQYTFKVRLSDGVDLEGCFGQNLTDYGGRINVTINARDENGKLYQAQISYRIQPSVVFMVYSHDGTLSTYGGHKYNGIQLNPFELVADGKDCLPLAGFFIRSDQNLSPQEAYAKRLAVGGVSSVQWKNSQDASNFNVPQPDAANEEDGVQAYLAQFARPVRALPERLNASYRLVFEVKLIPEAASTFRLETDKVEVNLRAQYPNLHLWVVPGEYRHTSSAFAYLEILPSHKPLIDGDLSLTITNPAGMTLDLDNCDEVQTTIEYVAGATSGDLTDGTAVWTLRYCGLTWDTLAQARFSVSCSHLDNTGEPVYSVTQEINVHQNVLDMLEAIYDDAGLKKKLNNPYFRKGEGKSELTDGTALAAIPTPPSDSSIPDWHVIANIPMDSRGPVWNIINKFDDKAPFVCFQMCNQIIEFLSNRSRIHTGGSVSASVKRMASMNGIEFDYYAMRPIHIWAGFFLSGCDRYEDYRALDPWWRQSWPETMLDLNNLMNKWDEKLLFGKISSGLPQSLADTLGWGISRALQTVQGWLSGSQGSADLIPPDLNVPLPSAGGVVYDLIFTAENDLADPNGMFAWGKANWYRSLINELKKQGS